MQKCEIVLTSRTTSQKYSEAEPTDEAEQTKTQISLMTLSMYNTDQALLI